MSAPTADDEPTGEPDGSWPSPAGVPGPPPPSVTPGSAPPPPDAAAPVRAGRGCLMALVAAGAAAVVLILVVLLLGGRWLGHKVDDLGAASRDAVARTGIETGSPDPAHPPQDDIRLGTCEVGPDGGVRAAGTVTNHTDQAAHYRVSVAFEQGTGPDKGPEFGSTGVEVDAVAPAATANWQASVPQRPAGLFTCRITRIDRWAAGTASPDGLGATGGG